MYDLWAGVWDDWTSGNVPLGCDIVNPVHTQAVPDNVPVVASKSLSDEVIKVAEGAVKVLL